MTQSNNVLEHREITNQIALESLSNDPMSTLHRVVVNSIDACNRSCGFCPRSTPEFVNKPQHRMTVETAEVIADAFSDINYSGVFSFTGWGEPLLNRDIYEIIKIFRETCKPARVQLQTNGDPLTTAFLSNLLSLDIDLIINAYDEPTYEKFRYVDGVILHKKYSHHIVDIGGLNNRAGTIVSSAWGLSLPQHSLTTPCYMPFYKLIVDWDANAYFCDYDWNKSILIGNIADMSIHDIWLSETMKQMRLRLFHGDRSLPPCSRCDAVGTIFGDRHAVALMKYYNDQRID